MVIYYRSKKLAEICNSERKAIRKFGWEIAQKLKQRLTEFNAAENLYELSCLPAPRCHPLEGKRAGQFAVDLKHPFRLVFEPADEPLPRKDDQSLDWKRIKCIRVLEVVDYHG